MSVGERADAGPAAWPDGFAASPGDRDALLVLLGLASLTPRKLLELATSCPSASACFRAVRRGRAASEADRDAARSADPSAVRRRVREAGARLVAVGDEDYPPELLDLFDPPAGLFVRGSRPGQFAGRVAVVGARNCSPAGREIAGALGRALASSGGCVVSGAARGVDSAAHRGALEMAGPTVAVLGSGIDVAYPRTHGPLIERIARSGSVVSEYPPGTPALPFRFPARNRIVAGLSRAVVVVEGAAGSGSMITADHALDLGREVFAVPGPVTSELAQAPLALLREGATPIRGPDDLLLDLGLQRDGQGIGGPDRPRSDPAAAATGEAGPDPAPTGPEASVWAALVSAASADALAARTGLPLPAVISALVTLEVRGLVRSVGGRYERRLGVR